MKALNISTISDNSNADLDLYLLNESFNSIIGQSNGVEVNESITTDLLLPGKYWIAVSFADDDPDNITTNYTLTFGQ